MGPAGGPVLPEIERPPQRHHVRNEQEGGQLCLLHG
ncbi:hypothetical protein BCL76_101399 [Streptomyces sp. CG 926]|nr:hypothetical protein BCL76_101399 [Streptomyces sp. CG 926]